MKINIGFTFLGIFLIVAAVLAFEIIPFTFLTTFLLAFTALVAFVGLLLEI